MNGKRSAWPPAGRGRAPGPGGLVLPGAGAGAAGEPAEQHSSRLCEPRECKVKALSTEPETKPEPAPQNHGGDSGFMSGVLPPSLSGPQR